MAKMMFCGCLARKPVNKNKNLVETLGEISKSHLNKIESQKIKRIKKNENFGACQTGN